MKSEEKTYKKIIGILFCVLILMPVLVINTHILFHKHHNEEQDHRHEVVTFCDKEVSMCVCNDFTVNFFDVLFVRNSYELPDVIFEVLNISLNESQYFNLFVKYQKGRSPPN